MPKGYTFRITHGDWPSAGPARKAVLTIVDPSGEEILTVRLGVAELRSLLKAVATGLGYVKVSRAPGQWRTTWLDDIERRIEPIMVAAQGAFPVPSKKGAGMAKKAA